MTVLDTDTPADVDVTGSRASLDSAEDATTSVASPQKLVRKKALQYTHPDYDRAKKDWDKFLDCYEANDIYRFVHKHPREHQERYDDRLARSYYLNYTASVVDLFIAYLFHAPITRPTEKDDKSSLAQLYRDADLCGTKYELFMQQTATFAQVTGHVGVLVDAPKIEQEVTTRREQRESGLRPYLRRIHAQQIMDWELDSKGRFEWAKIQVDRPQERSWEYSADSQAVHYQIWDKRQWEEWKVLEDEEDPVPVDSGEHNLGEVPLVIVYNDKSLLHQWFGVSAIRDISDVNLAILNWSSFGDEEIAERCLNILAMEEADSDGSKTIELGHNNVLEFPSGCENPPYYLTPGETPLKLIGEWIDRAKDEIYRLAKLGGSTGLLGVREATSGIAYAFEFNETNQSLAKKAEFLEKAERQILRFVDLWSGENDAGEERVVIYPREFGVEDFLMELEVLIGARANFTSPRAIKEIEKKIARKMFAKDPQELRGEIEKEIEEADPQGPQQFGFENIPTELISGSGSEGSANAEPQDKVPATTTGDS